MRPRISIRGSVRLSVRPSVRRSIHPSVCPSVLRFFNPKKSLFSDAVKDGIELVVTRGEEGGTVVTGGDEGRGGDLVTGVTTGGDASDVW